MKNFYLDNRLVDKFSGQKGFASLLVIGAVVLVGIVVFLVTSGKLNTANKDQDNQSASKSASPEVAVPTQKPAVVLSDEPFSSTKLGFSIKYPTGWKVRSETNGVSIYLPAAAGSDKADAMVIATTAPLGALKGSKLSTLADLQKVQLEKQFSNMNVVKEGAIKIGDRDAYEIEFVANIKGENMHARYIMLTTTLNLYGILASANEGMWNQYKDTLDASIQTFKLQ